MSTPAIAWRDRFWGGWRRRRWRGFHRAWGFAQARGGAAEILVRCSLGPTFSLDPNGYIDGFVIEQGFYESEVLDALRPSLAAGGVLWDIGANIGLHGVTAKSLYPAATVCAFEPAPSTMARLQCNAALNAVTLNCYALALSDRDGVAPLHLGSAGNPGMSTLSPWQAGNYAGTCHVTTARGDRLVATSSAPAPTVLKLDVEGHEAAVLRGLGDVLRTAACRVVVFEDGPDNQTEPKQLLRAAGFRIGALRRHESTAHALANFLAEKP